MQTRLRAVPPKRKLAVKLKRKLVAEPRKKKTVRALAAQALAEAGEQLLLLGLSPVLFQHSLLSHSPRLPVEAALKFQPAAVNLPLMSRARSFHL